MNEFDWVLKREEIKDPQWNEGLDYLLHKRGWRGETDPRYRAELAIRTTMDRFNVRDHPAYFIGMKLLGLSVRDCFAEAGVPQEVIDYVMKIVDAGYEYEEALNRGEVRFSDDELSAEPFEEMGR